MGGTMPIDLPPVGGIGGDKKNIAIRMNGASQVDGHAVYFGGNRLFGQSATYFV